jgi:hypothetical protein
MANSLWAGHMSRLNFDNWQWQQVYISEGTESKWMYAQRTEIPESRAR